MRGHKMKNILSWILFCAASCGWALDLELTQGISAALPIGINSFGDSVPAENITQIITHDLQFSGRFKIVVATDNSISSWRFAGADSVLRGELRSTGYHRYEVKFELLDAASQGRLLLTRTFQIKENELRPLAHYISDIVYEKLTGEKGVFSTKIAYIVVQRSKQGSEYALEIADVDGYNDRRLLVSRESIMSPAWSPDGKKIAYVSFEKKKAQVFIIDVTTGQRQLVTDFYGINGAPAWSPDGRQLAVVLSKGGNPKIYTVDLASGQLKQLTFGDAIDTEPRFSPDGHAIIFTSGRGGSPQIYSLNTGDGKITRMTYAGNYNARASYTPDKKKIVVMHRDENKHFNIAVQDIEQGQLTVITDSTSDESPSVAPNGRLIVYATHRQDKGVLGIVSLDGRVQIRLPVKEGDMQEPAWSPFL